MIHILICDDDQTYITKVRDHLNKLIKQIEQEKYQSFTWDIVTKDTPTDALQYCMQNKIDIAFLDIDMPILNGFDIATTLKEKQKDVKLIFVSNLDQLVYTSFRFNPFRFIRKTELEKELTEAFTAAVKELLVNQEHLVVKSNDYFQKIFYSDIMYIESKGNYVEITTSQGQVYTHRVTLTALENMLAGYDFIRIHSGFLVSMRKIKLLHKDAVELQNDKSFKISRKYLNEVREAYHRYLMR